MQFDNKVCIVTGGNAGIGRCIAESFSKEGARVYVIDRDIDHDTDENIFCISSATKGIFQRKKYWKVLPNGFCQKKRELTS